MNDLYDFMVGLKINKNTVIFEFAHVETKNTFYLITQQLLGKIAYKLVH